MIQLHSHETVVAKRLMSNLHICSFSLLGTVLHCTSWNGLIPVVN